MKSIRRAFTAPVAAMLLSLSACAGGFVVVDSGPPPHAPANGYRHRHPVDHVVLIYRTDLALYAVSGYHDCYYYGDQYYRLRGGAWYYAPRIDGPWVTVSYSSIPPGLHHKYKEPHGKKHKHGKRYKGGY